MSGFWSRRQRDRDLDVGIVKEVTREMWGQEGLEQLRRDARHALRALRRAPIFTIAVILTLAIGIGATTVMFTIVDHVVLRPLAYRDVSRLVVVRERASEMAKGYSTFPVNARLYLAWRLGCTICEDVAAIRPLSVTLAGLGDPERIGAARVSVNLFAMLGVAPQVGRFFTADEDRRGQHLVVVLSDRIWRRQFNANPFVLGRAITLSGQSFTVVGVLPPDFYFPKKFELGELVRLSAATDLFIPLALTPQEATTPGEHDYAVVVRMRPGATPAQVRAQLDAVGARSLGPAPQREPVTTVVMPLQSQVVGDAERGLLLLLGAVVAVLLIVCVNLANLLLARTANRQREAAVRVALGADRWRLVRQALTEGLVLALLGGTLGVLLAYVGVPALIAVAPSDLPRLSAVRLDTRILLFALGVSGVTGLAFGVLPALRFADADPGEVLKAGSRSTTEGRRAGRTRSALISSQVALSTLLLVATGLLLTSFFRVMRVDKGFDTVSALALDVVLPPAGYPNTERRQQFHERAVANIAALPGVTSVAVVNTLPLDGESEVNTISRENDPTPPEQRPLTNVRFVSPGYFATLGIAVRRGRALTENDRGRPVAIVSERVARTLWGSDDPIGKRISANDDGVLHEVIGLVPDVRTVSLERESSLVIYVPFWERGLSAATLVVRTSVPPESMERTVRARIRESDATVPIAHVRTIEQVISDAVAHRMFQIALLALFALTAVVIGSVGIYGVVAHSLAGRRREIGVRTALGARPADIHRLVVGGGLAPVAVGLVVGFLVSLGIGRAFRSLLFDVHTTDPILAGAATAALLLGVSIVACYVPARRVIGEGVEAALRGE